jgi:hypothetical protein
MHEEQLSRRVPRRTKSTKPPSQPPSPPTRVNCAEATTEDQCDKEPYNTHCFWCKETGVCMKNSFRGECRAGQNPPTPPQPPSPVDCEAKTTESDCVAASACKWCKKVSVCVPSGNQCPTLQGPTPHAGPDSECSNAEKYTEPKVATLADICGNKDENGRYDFRNCVLCPDKKKCVPKEKEKEECFEKCTIGEVFFKSLPMATGHIRRCREDCSSASFKFNDVDLRFQEGTSDLLCCYKRRIADEKCIACGFPYTQVLNCKCEEGKEKRFAPKGEPESEIFIECCNSNQIYYYTAEKNGCGTCEKEALNIIAYYKESKFAAEEFKQWLGTKWEEFVNGGDIKCEVIYQKIRELCDDIIKEVKNAQGISEEARAKLIDVCVEYGKDFDQNKCFTWLKFYGQNNIYWPCSNNYRNNAIQKLSTLYSQENCKKCKEELIKKCEEKVLPAQQKATEYTPSKAGPETPDPKPKMEEIDIRKQLEEIEECIAGTSPQGPTTPPGPNPPQGPTHQ